MNDRLGLILKPFFRRRGRRRLPSPANWTSRSLSHGCGLPESHRGQHDSALDVFSLRERRAGFSVFYTNASGFLRNDVG
jgi:hypothetical protein